MRTFPRRRAFVNLFWLLVLPMLQLGPSHAQSLETKLVFAHNHGYASYGNTVEGYKQDIRDAKNAGLDGFALNIGRWEGENGNYQRKVAKYFQAAQELGPGFKLFLSFDQVSAGKITVEEGISGREVREAMEIYANHPNY